MKQCRACLEEKPICAFPRDRDGHRHTCKACHSNRATLAAEHARNRKFNELLRRSFVLMLVTGIYSHDYVKGRTRTCIYESMYGSHALTIDALRMCPLTWEFEV